MRDDTRTDPGPSPHPFQPADTFGGPRPAVQDAKDARDTEHAYDEAERTYKPIDDARRRQHLQTLEDITGSNTERGGHMKKIHAGGDTQTTLRELAKIVTELFYGIGETRSDRAGAREQQAQGISAQEAHYRAEEQAREHRDSKLSGGNRDQRSQHDRAREEAEVIPPAGSKPGTMGRNQADKPREVIEREEQEQREREERRSVQPASRLRTEPERVPVDSNNRPQ